MVNSKAWADCRKWWKKKICEIKGQVETCSFFNENIK
nr:MAG TPA: hypothetical protein [Caudoviricetes sp.]